MPTAPTMHMMDRVSSATGGGGGGGGQVERMDICMEGPGGTKLWTWVEVHTSIPKGIERCCPPSHSLATRVVSPYLQFLNRIINSNAFI